jgi:hypothetical protein
VAVILNVVVVAHAAYVVLVRPYSERTEQVFATFFAVAHCVLGLCAGAVVMLPADDADGPLVAAVWTSVVINVGFYVQLLVLTVLEVRELWQESARLDDGPALSVPMRAS